MAMKAREKQLLGVMLLIGAAAVLFLWCVPALGAIQTAWAKKTELETGLKNMTVSETALNAEIAALQQQMKLPNDIIIRKHTPDNLQANVKSILDKVLQLAYVRNNAIISLMPWKEVPAIIPPPAPTTPGAAPAAPATGSAPATGTTPDPNAPPAPPPPPPLTVVGYELAIRGTYGSVQAFLKAMSEQKELVEISNIELVNEQGPDRGLSAASPQEEQENSEGPLLDPTRPIKLIAKLRLVLEPENMVITPQPAAPAAQ